jgi:hypothetical protein
MALPAEIYIQGDTKAVSLEGRRLLPVEPIITALRTKQRQRVTETAILRHVLPLHLLMAAFLRLSAISLVCSRKRSGHKKYLINDEASTSS